MTTAITVSLFFPLKKKTHSTEIENKEENIQYRFVIKLQFGEFFRIQFTIVQHSYILLLLERYQHYIILPDYYRAKTYKQ